MAYNNKNFSVMAYANGFTLWNYQTTDKMATLKADGYFNPTSGFVNKGDMILTLAETDGAIVPAVLCISNASRDSVSVVTVGAAS